MKKFKDLKEKINNNNKFINDTDKLISIVNEFKGVSPTSNAKIKKKKGLLYLLIIKINQLKKY